jgi:hypothetical protein
MWLDAGGGPRRRPRLLFDFVYLFLENLGEPLTATSRRPRRKVRLPPSPLEALVLPNQTEMWIAMIVGMMRHDYRFFR